METLTFIMVLFIALQTLYRRRSTPELPGSVFTTSQVRGELELLHLKVDALLASGAIDWADHCGLPGEFFKSLHGGAKNDAALQYSRVRGCTFKDAEAAIIAVERALSHRSEDQA